MGKCPYTQNCKLFNAHNSTCTKDDGDYYGPGRMAGCGRDFQENGKKAMYYKPRNKSLSILEKIKKSLGANILE